MNQFRIDGKTAVITGGGSGLGLGIARVFIAAGAKVVIILTYLVKRIIKRQ